jgi:hypothetical protein
MGIRELFGGKSDGIAYEPTRGGMQPMMDANGKPVRLSELSKHQRKGVGMGGATKRAPRAERRQRTEWGR